MQNFAQEFIVQKPVKKWLNGITIVDLSSLLPCPFATHLLAKFGARVIKIESPTRLDPAREFGYVPPGKTSSCYRALNDIKELQLLDLKNKTDREKLYELIARADGAIEGYRPEVRKRLGIEYETLAEINPALVYCSVGGFIPRKIGKVDYTNRAGHDINFVARSGILDQTRDANGHRVLPGLPVGDYIVGYAAALRMACALVGAKLSGIGTHIEVTIEEALREVQTPFLYEAIESGEPPEARNTLVTGKYPCYQIYELQEGAFALGALEPKFWEAFCKTLGRQDLIPGQFETGPAGQKIVHEVQSELNKRPFSDWLRTFSTVDCCIEPILSVKDVLNGL